MNLGEQIIQELKREFGFKNVRGEWLQGGKCPQCGKNEVFCAASKPKMVRCGRQDRCGWEDSVRNLLPDLFENWSDRFQATDDKIGRASCRERV